MLCPVPSAQERFKEGEGYKGFMSKQNGLGWKGTEVVPAWDESRKTFKIWEPLYKVT